ncbi:MAG TPA: hypothetical protein VGZ93_01705 [Candidatus Methylacidiphilales bacterium]|jgi:hypothetical protein|nr:hypothetical protein [Candidatus Methylacidiphilales bacterium]
MNLTYTDGRNWLPHGVIASDPPIEGPSFYQLGFSLGRVTAEYWTAKTIRAYGSWSPDGITTAWTFDQSISANGGRLPAQRVTPGSDYLAAGGGLPAFNGTLEISINWADVYKVGDLYYPYITVVLGAGRFTSSYDNGPGGSPSAVVMMAFGQTLACQDYNGSGCAGSLTIETTEYST